MKTKTCNVCEETKPLTGFYHDARGADGYRNNCKLCKCNQQNITNLRERQGSIVRRPIVSENIIHILVDGKWHSIEEIENICNNSSAHGSMYHIKNILGFKIIKKIDNGHIFYRLILPGDEDISSNDRSKKQDCSEQFNLFIDMMSDLEWHSTNKIRAKFNIYKTLFHKARKDGFVLEKEYSVEDGCYCYRMVM